MKDRVVLEFLWEMLRKDKEDEVNRLLRDKCALEDSNSMLINKVEELEDKYKQSCEKVERLEKELSNLSGIPR